MSIAETDESIWLRGPGPPPPELARVHWRTLQQLLGEDGLAPLDSAIPTARLPDLDWSPLDRVSRPAAASSALPGALETDARVKTKLIRSPQFAETNLLCLNLASFARWASTAPEIRLKPLRFACSDQKIVAVAGSPVPPLPSEHFVLTDGIACPAGWTWDPPVPAAVLTKMLGMNPGDIALLQVGGEVDVIPAANFVPVTRAAVRLTLTKPE